MKYDDITWHSGGDFPKDLPPHAGGTHIGMFLAWCILNDLTSDFHNDDAVKELKNRKISGRQFLTLQCDGKLTDEDFSDEGNAFTLYYFYTEEGYGPYIDDYVELFAEELPSLYHVKDSWENFDLLENKIDIVYQAWKSA